MNEANPEKREREREKGKEKNMMAEEASAPCVIFFCQVTLLICLI